MGQTHVRLNPKQLSMDRRANNLTGLQRKWLTHALVVHTWAYLLWGQAICSITLHPQETKCSISSSDSNSQLGCVQFWWGQSQRAIIRTAEKQRAVPNPNQQLKGGWTGNRPSECERAGTGIQQRPRRRLPLFLKGRAPYGALGCE